MTGLYKLLITHNSEQNKRKIATNTLKNNSILDFHYTVITVWMDASVNDYRVPLL